MAQEQNSLQPTIFTFLTTEKNSNVEFELNVITMMTSRELTLAQFQKYKYHHHHRTRERRETQPNKKYPAI